MAKTKKIQYKLPYIGYDKKEEYDVVYNQIGCPIVIIEITNPIKFFDADADLYIEQHNMYTNLLKNLSDNFVIQKLDILTKQIYNSTNDATNFLQEQYENHFNGRVYKKIITYFAISDIPSGKLYKYNKDREKIFFTSVNRVFQLLKEKGSNPRYTRIGDIEDIMCRTLGLDFKNDSFAVDNLKTTTQYININDKYMKNISVIDTETVQLPNTISDYTLVVSAGNRTYPTDIMNFLYDIDNTELILYSQTIKVPNQNKIINELKRKAKRHGSFPDPSNTESLEDIDYLLEDVSRNSQLIVQCNFNIAIVTNNLKELDTAFNTITNKLSDMNIKCSANSHNQLELYNSLFLGNHQELKEYDLFTTSSDASVAFFFKETNLRDENSSFYLKFTDRQGVPIKVDMNCLNDSGRLNNKNKFVIGPSGSGKSFWTNYLVQNYIDNNYHVVLIDTGDSYSGISSYFDAVYIKHTEDNPITMNPFVMTKEELDESRLEKIDFLTSLIGLLWKGADGTLHSKEYDIIAEVVNLYYTYYFLKKETLSIPQSIEELEILCDKNNIKTAKIKETTLNIFSTFRNQKNYYNILQIEQTATSIDIKESYNNLAKKYHPDINKDVDQNIIVEINQAYNTLGNPTKRKEYDILLRGLQFGEVDKTFVSEAEQNKEFKELYKQELVKVYKDAIEELEIFELNFNSFYDFSRLMIPKIMNKNDNLEFDLTDYSYLLKKFYKGGRFETILNKNVDNSLFDEKFIVFEVDNIKDNKVLFPIVTLIIINIFTQKLMLRKNNYKALIIEEAWKAIANKLMGGFIHYLYKTARKHAGECIVVTQELNDILGNEVVKDSIISNSDTFIMLDQTKFKDNYEEIANLLSLSEVEQSKVFTINNLDNKKNRAFFKEFYIKRGEKGEVYGNEVSFSQYLAYSTKKEEKNAVNIYKAGYENFAEALLEFEKTMKLIQANMETFCLIVNSYDKVLDEKAINYLLSQLELKKSKIAVYSKITEQITKEKKTFSSIINTSLQLEFQV